MADLTRLGKTLKVETLEKTTYLPFGTFRIAYDPATLEVTIYSVDTATIVFDGVIGDLIDTDSGLAFTVSTLETFIASFNFGGSGGGITDVTATSPLISSGGATPDISIEVQSDGIYGIEFTSGVAILTDISVAGDFLPLSGGTLTGNTFITSPNNLFCNKLEAYDSPNALDLFNATFNNEGNEALQYITTPVIDDPLDIPTKEYVDSNIISGMCYMTTNTSITNITVADTYVKIVGTTTTDSSLNNKITSVVSNRLTYTGTDTKVLKLTFSGSVDTTGGTQYATALFKNGIYVPGSEIYLPVDNGGGSSTHYEFSNTVLASASTNDYFEVFIKSLGVDADVICTHLTLTI